MKRRSKRHSGVRDGGLRKSNVHESKEGYDLYAEFYDKSNDYLNSFEKDALVRMLRNVVMGGYILDLGAGTGRLIKYLKGKIVAADISEEMLKIMKKKFSKVEIVCADAENLPFKDGSFDLVVAAFLIVHLKNPEKCFSEVYRVLKDGGTFVVTNINQRKAPKLEIDGRSEIVIKSYYHRPEDIRKTLEKNLFKIEKEEFVYENGTWINQIIKAVKV